MAAGVIFLALTCCSIVISVYLFAKFLEFKDYFEILKTDNKFYNERYDSLLNNSSQSVDQIGRLIEYLDKSNEDNYNRFRDINDSITKLDDKTYNYDQKLEELENEYERVLDGWRLALDRVDDVVNFNKELTLNMHTSSLGAMITHSDYDEQRDNLLYFLDHLDEKRAAMKKED